MHVHVKERLQTMEPGDRDGPMPLSLSPSFNSYSSGKLAEIAARVVDEFSRESANFDSDQSNAFEWRLEDLNSQFQEGESANPQGRRENDDNDDDDCEFEFACVSREPNAFATSADDIFYNGQIRAVYPVFNTDLVFKSDLKQNDEDLMKSKTTKVVRRLPLRTLMNEERESNSCSSSEADELEGIPAGTYCVWSPKPPGASIGNCKKSNSTGSSKRWKLRNLFYRSNSIDRHDALVFLTPSKKSDEVSEISKGKGNSGDDKAARKVKPTGITAFASNGGPNGETHYAKDEGTKRKSYLPYRPDLVSFFSNANTTSKNLHPF